jgi:hypothetical protein
MVTPVLRAAKDPLGKISSRLARTDTRLVTLSLSKCDWLHTGRVSLILSEAKDPLVKVQVYGDSSLSLFSLFRIGFIVD